MGNSEKFWTLGLVLVTGLLLSDCAVKVHTFYDASAPYSDYQTFCWFDNCQFTIDGPAYIKKDSVTVEKFKNAIVNELKRKGYTYDQNNPDFLLYMHIKVKEQEGILTPQYSTGDPEDWQGAFPIGNWGDRTYTFLEGSMIIDIADAAESRMIWRSDAVEYLDVTTDITDSRLRRGVRKVLRKFPPNNVK